MATKTNRVDTLPAGANNRPTARGNGQAPTDTPLFVRMDTVAPERLDWLWPGKIPMGKVSIVAGDPGLGKSLLTLDMASRVSRGFRWPDSDEDNVPGTVILLSAEDDPADTIRPRLDAAGADVSKIVLLKSIQLYDKQKKKMTERMFSLEQDIQALDQAAEQNPDAKLIVIDPISAYCGKTDSHKDAEVRGLLAPLAEFAARRRVAVVCVDHLNKGDRPAIYRVMGSLGFVAFARAVWGIIKAPNQPSCRLMLPIKCNLSADTGGLSYRVIDQGGIPCLAWGRESVSVTIDEVMAAERATQGGRGAELREAAQWLAAQLAGGPVAQQDLEQRAKEAGLAWRTVKRAKSALKIKSRRKGFGPGAVWTWQLPDPPGDKEAGIAPNEEVELYEHNGPYETSIENIEAIEGQLSSTPKEAIEAIEAIEGHENGRSESGTLWDEAHGGASQ